MPPPSTKIADLVESQYLAQDQSNSAAAEEPQMNTARQRAPKVKQKAKKQSIDKSANQQGSKPTLFYDQLIVDLGQRSVRRKDDLDPIRIIDRLSIGNPVPEARVLIADHGALHTECVSNSSSRTSSDSSSSSKQIQKSSEEKKRHKLPKSDGLTYTLDNFVPLLALNSLIEQHGRISHMGILDPSFAFFVNKSRKAALYYKIKNKVAVVGGNPLCDSSQWPALLAEFAQFRKKHSLGIAYLGATDEFAKYAMEQKGWVSMRFGTERAFNPMTNKVLLETEGKRMVKQNKALLDPKRGGMRVDIYVPAQNQDLELQAQLMHIYEAWRNHRNESGKPQAYMTVFDPFALPHLMVYIYTSDSNGQPNGFAALRRIRGGYHIDPYCALPDAPKGTSDLLIYAALAILNRAGVQYLGLGFEPAEELTDVHGMSASMTRITESAYRRTFSRLPISGKKAFHDKWYPDEELDAGLYIIYPDGRPDLHHSLATMHFANVSAKEVLKGEMKDQLKKIESRIHGRKDEQQDAQDGKAGKVGEDKSDPFRSDQHLYKVRQGLLSATNLSTSIGSRLREVVS